MEILIASNHAGYELKEEIKEFFRDQFKRMDFGAFSTKRVDKINM